MTSHALQFKTDGAAHRIHNEAEALDVARALSLRFAEGAAIRDRDRVLPYKEMDELARSGLLAITVPKAYGGIDVSNAVLGEVIALLAEADGSIGQIPQNHFYILEALRIEGSEEQKAFYFGRALAGDKFGNALSEIGTKTVGHYNTTIRPDGEGFVINGKKFYSTGVLFADWIVIFANDENEKLTMSFTPKGTQGIELVDDWDGIGQRTTGSGTTVLNNVHVPGDAVVRHHRSFERPQTIGSVGQIIQAAVDLGIARAALRDTITFVTSRSRPWMDAGVEKASEDPLTIHRVGQIAVRIDAGAALIAEAGRKVDRARETLSESDTLAATLAVASAKVLTTEAALEASNTLFELAGTQSARAEHNFDRHWRNARTHTLHDPVRWKFHAVGNYLLNGVLPPKNGAL
ncbi:SfnB family sulfur acquisition oxidoreductase [Allorhizobium taibaishanense]|uniref:Dibenzothiophene monooxygenase n=1 Tax=Allorhizobium taibaishanense TaxID=887144 RepID=A0A1Q9A7J0_9HYPH|nr:SfnB family sulfur acquisition oxidoreductase [Allorhizobium taibaishanense]MBB4008250.1 SfnB family sulfur acquisition oxidoreductase [Allorhizobium taibaishanense]OLP50550.1 SfnB family sulfur acquisition oxidoreductase [Allorhizobium taibaishanense]